MFTRERTRLPLHFFDKSFGVNPITAVRSLTSRTEAARGTDGLWRWLSHIGKRVEHTRPDSRIRAQLPAERTYLPGTAVFAKGCPFIAKRCSLRQNERISAGIPSGKIGENRNPFF